MNCIEIDELSRGESKKWNGVCNPQHCKLYIDCKVYTNLSIKKIEYIISIMNLTEDKKKILFERCLEYKLKDKGAI